MARQSMNSANVNMSKTDLQSQIAICVVVFGVLVGLVRPTLAGDAANGKRLAERWCAACHVVSADQREANADAPPFDEIAKRPNFSENGMNAFLQNPHAKMPNMDLTRVEAGDIAAYISSLR